ncbi:MAG: hypothetical protein V4667_02205 [Bacteroidota bacterium]
MKNVKDYNHLILIFSIIVSSYFLYSSRYYALLNSDDALNILMAHNYKWPQDIYCWGQNRGGTLIAVLAQPFIKLFSFKAINAVSVANYLVLILGYFCFSSLFKNNFSKVVFAVIWFLPFQRFVDITRFPIGVEYSLIAVLIILLNSLSKTDSVLKKNLLLISVLLISLIAIWVSDLAIVSICNLFFVSLLFNYFKNKKFSNDKTILIYFLVGIVFVFLSINYVKSIVNVQNDNYLLLNNFNEIIRALVVLVNANFDVLVFKTKEILVSIYALLTVLFLLFLTAFIIKKKLVKNLFLNQWIAFFLLDFIIIFIVFLVASWVLANGMGRWYFVATYISLSLLVLLIIEQLNKYNLKLKFFKFALLIIVLVGAISPVYSMKYKNPKRLIPMTDIIVEFNKLGKIGVIGEYWNSYIISCANPDSIVATPHDMCEIKNKAFVGEVFSRKNIYVVRDMWMDYFPDTLLQFGNILIQDGKPFELGDCKVCKYKKIK